MNIQAVIDALLTERAGTGQARKATAYLNPKSVITATLKHRPNKRSKRLEVLLKIGAPNHRERAFIKACLKAGEPFPVKRIQLKFYPVK